MPFLWLITLVVHISLGSDSYGFTQRELSQEGQPKHSEIVLLDGSRISVEFYEIRDKNIVFRTIDGKLQSVPLIYVDLQATTEGRATPKHDPDLESTLGLTTHAPAQSSSENVQNLSASSSLTSESTEERVRRLQSLNWEITAIRANEDIVIDGKFDEHSWQLADWVTEFYRTETNQGQLASENTEAAILYDKTNLYIAMKAYDSKPEEVQSWAMFRDSVPVSDDAVGIMIDPYNDHRSAVFFATNSNGLVFDMLQTGERSDTRTMNWDTVWEVRASQFSRGWQVEIAIPFKSLRFKPRGPGEEVVFGIGFKRNIPRGNEDVIWPFVSNDSTWYRPAELGHLRGLTDIRPGRAIEIRPYTLASGVANYTNDTKKSQTGVGGDIKWGVTSGLTADFSVNTDFAQEEADIQQTNLTRFSLFFPEKRQVFLEGQRMFQFGLPREVDLVFTRRIGLSQTNAIIPLMGVARLSGRQGRYSLGAMNVQTRESLGTPGENFTVLRLRRDIFSRSNIGAIFTNRQGGNTYNRVYGADANFYFNRFWFVEGFVAKTKDPSEREGTHSAFGGFSYETDLLGASYGYLDIGENFDPGIGFVRRPGSRENYVEARVSPRPNLSWVRQLELKASLSNITDGENVLETRSKKVDFATTLESGDQLNVSHESRFEFLSNPFALRPDLTISGGNYNFRTLELGLKTYRRRQMILNLSFLTGSFWAGHRDNLSMRSNYRINRHVNLDLNYEINWVDLPQYQSKFTTHLASTRLRVAFRTDMILMGLLQYNSITNELASNIRFNWIPKPGSDFFVVYNELDDWRYPFQPKVRSLSIKFNYLLAL